jgi:hypothetical protein
MRLGISDRHNTLQWGMTAQGREPIFTTGPERTVSALTLEVFDIRTLDFCTCVFSQSTPTPESEWHGGKIQEIRYEILLETPRAVWAWLWRRSATQRGRIIA